MDMTKTRLSFKGLMTSTIDNVMFRLQKMKDLEVETLYPELT
jgi:hypothetical protein